MDAFDKEIKEIVKSETWEVPEKIDSKIDNILENLEKPVQNKRKPLKVAVIFIAFIVSSVTSAFAIGNVINYFKYNKDSAFISNKDKIEKIGESVNLSSKDKGIEFKVDAIAADGNYLSIFYTIKSDKKIKDIDPYYKTKREISDYDNEILAIEPFVSIKANKAEILDPAAPEREATIVSDNELKGMCRISLINSKLNNEFDISVYTNKLYGQEGNWSINTKVNLKNKLEETYRYKIAKDGSIKDTVRDGKQDVQVENKVHIDEVNISPLGSQMVFSSQIEEKENTFQPINRNIALFNQDGKSLDVIDNGGGRLSFKKGCITTLEFLKGDKETRALNMVPYSIDYSKEMKMIEPKLINKLPIEFNTSNYGKVIVEQVKIEDKKIKIIFYKDGVVPSQTEFWFFDENGNRIEIGKGFLDYSINRHTARYTATIDLPGDFKDASKIKKISTYESPINLNYDNGIKFDLIKNKK